METRSPRFAAEIARWVIGVVAVIALAAFLVWAFGERMNIDGHSMTAVLSDGDTVLVNKLSYRFHDVERFDIVSFTYGDGRASVKRVVGLPGEHVKISNGMVYIEDEPIEFPFDGAVYNVAGIAENTIMLASDEYFLLGDNGDSSEDSRFNAVGTVPRENITGKIWFRIAPLGSIGFVRSGK